jgi:hypothetical protein
MENTVFIGLVYQPGQGYCCVLRFIIEYSSLRDFCFFSFLEDFLKVLFLHGEFIEFS